MAKTIISTAGAPAAIGTYSQAVRVGDTVYLSGQIGLDPQSGQLVEGIDAQITRAKAEVQRVEAEGSIAVARATLAEMAAKGEANAVKQAELEASIKLAEARLKEVDLLKQAASAAEFAVARQRDLGEASAQAAEKAAAGAKTAGDAAEVFRRIEQVVELLGILDLDDDHPAGVVGVAVDHADVVGDILVDADHRPADRRDGELEH